jgi:DNA-binding GntR family transcriptional regulator
MSQQARSRIAPYRRAQFNDPGRLAQSHKEHGAFVEAIEKRDPQKAYEVMYDHILAAQDMALAYLKSIHNPSS